MVIGLDASRANVSQRTGTERYAFEVLRRLIRLLPEHQLRLYIREPLLLDWGEVPANVEICVLRWAPGLLWSHLRLSWELFWRRPDLLFVPADTVPIIHPRRTVTTIHDVAFERWPELYQQQSVQRRLGIVRPLIHALVRLFTFGRYGASERDYHRWSVRQAVRTCPVILTVSEFSKSEIVATLGVDPNRVHVTPIAPRPPEYFNAIRQSGMSRSASIPEKFFLFVGRLESKKNIGLILQAYASYRQKNNLPIDLVLAGRPGYGWETAVQHVGPNGLAGVHVLGWQPDDVVDLLYVRATAMVFISQYEGFGIPALESCSAGVPVIASRHGSLPEVLGPAAYYIDTDEPATIAEGYQRVTTDQPLRHELQILGLARAQRYTWDHTAADTKRVLLGLS